MTLTALLAEWCGPIGRILFPCGVAVLTVIGTLAYGLHAEAVHRRRMRAYHALFRQDSTR